MFAGQWVDRVDAHDRELLARWVIGGERGTPAWRVWLGITAAGSAVVTIGSVLMPLLFAAWPHAASWRAGVALAASHLAVQAIKRVVSRERPVLVPLIACPDRFSFPSGHATASLSVALTYALIFPAMAAPLVGFGLLVGWSRVALGVHYPGDVVAGQAIAIVTALAVWSLR